MEKLISVNQMSLNFNLREPKKNKCTNVYAVIKCGAIQFKLPIGCKCKSWQWNKKQQLPTITNTMNKDDIENSKKVINTINQVRFAYIEYFSYLCSGHQMTTPNEVKESINNILKQVNTTMANTENLQKGKSVKATTLLKKAFNVYYSEVKTSVKESAQKTAFAQLSAFFKYCEEIGKDAKSMLSQKGLNEYKSYLIKKQRENKENGAKRYDSNTQINNKCQAVARYINSVMVSHIDFAKYNIERVNYQNLEEVKAKGEDKKRRPLANVELEKLQNDNVLNAKEKEYRDLFLLECNCAYRIGDTAKLFDKSLQKHYHKGEFELIMINTQKENIDAVILLTPIVKEILERYENGFKYANPNSKEYSNTFNTQIKKIAKKCGLNRMETFINSHNEKETKPLYDIIGSHFARYTFINNALKLGFTPNEIKDFTGHADDTMINEVYSIVTKSDKIDNAVRALERIYNTNEQKKTNESKDNDVVNKLEKLVSELQTKSNKSELINRYKDLVSMAKKMILESNAKIMDLDDWENIESEIMQNGEILNELGIYRSQYKDTISFLKDIVKMEMYL